MYNIVGMVVALLMVTPMAQAKPPRNALKPRKIKKILKKVERLDDLHYIPLHRDYDMNKVARVQAMKVILFIMSLMGSVNLIKLAGTNFPELGRT